MIAGPRYAREIADGREITPDMARWLRIAFRRHLDDGCDLEVALAINGTARTRARDSALLRAAQIIDAGRGLSAWQLAGELSRHVKHFAAVRRRLIERGIVDAQQSALDAALFESCQVCSRQLTSQEKLFGLLTDQLAATGQSEVGILGADVQLPGVNHE